MRMMDLNLEIEQSSFRVKNVESSQSSNYVYLKNATDR